MRRRLLLVSFVALGLAAATPAAGQEDPGSEKARVDQRIAALQAEIDAAKAEEGVLTSQLSAVVSELRAAQGAVDEAQGSLDLLEGQLASEQEKLGRLTALLKTQTARLVRLQREYARVVAVLEQRVRAAYINEPPDALAFIVSASSFADLVDNYEFVKRIGAQDQRIALEVETARQKAADERRATARTRVLTAAVVSVIAARTDEARSVRDRLAAGRDTLAAARRLKAERDLRRAPDPGGLPRGGGGTRSAERISRSGHSKRSDRRRLDGDGITFLCGAHLAGERVGRQRIRLRWGRMHEGVDIAASTGTPIWAAAAGTVIHAGWLGGYGNLVVVDHGNGLATAYAHASAILVNVGQSVSQGQTVSLVGSTGNSSGPHLHFEVRVNGVAVDPLLYL